MGVGLGTSGGQSYHRAIGSPKMFMGVVRLGRLNLLSIEENAATSRLRWLAFLPLNGFFRLRPNRFLAFVDRSQCGDGSVEWLMVRVPFR
jgi:hypothetical protein